MKKTLLLVFIHGFKGSDHTFHNFPTDVQALLAHTLPKIDVVTVQYPRFETKGELKGTVAKFKEWYATVKEANWDVKLIEERVQAPEQSDRPRGRQPDTFAYR